jgi:hypothetical protein
MSRLRAVVTVFCLAVLFMAALPGYGAAARSRSRQRERQTPPMWVSWERFWPGAGEPSPGYGH